MSGKEAFEMEKIGGKLKVCMSILSRITAFPHMMRQGDSPPGEILKVIYFDSAPHHPSYFVNSPPSTMEFMDC